MPGTQPLFEVRAFRGINNVDDPARVLPSGASSFLVEGENIDIDNKLMPHLRYGFGDASLSGAGMHSLWSNQDICLFVQNADLKRLNPDYSASTLRSAVGAARMAYVDAAGVVYFTNGTVIGYIEDFAALDFPDPAETYKVRMKPGHLIEHYNVRLYVARDNEVWFSDAAALRRTDERRNFEVLPLYVTMLRAVEDGIYVSTLKAIYFMAGGDPAETVLRKVADYGAILGTDILIDAENVGAGDAAGKAIIYTSPQGVCLAMAGGQFKNLTKEYYQVSDPMTRGSAMIRAKDGYWQYLASLWQ